MARAVPGSPHTATSRSMAFRALARREREWLASRRRLVRRWPLVGGACALGLIALIAALWWRTPLLLDPWMLAGRLRDGSVDQATLMLLAALLPVVMLVLFGVMFVLLLLLGVGMASERRLLDTVARLAAPDEGFEIAARAEMQDDDGRQP